MAKVIGISGKIGSGKNYLAEQLIEELHKRGYTTIDASFAKPLKVELSNIIKMIGEHANEDLEDIINEIAKDFRMSNVEAAQMVGFLITDIKLNTNLDAYSRTEGVRRALQFLGTDIRRAEDPDYWVKAFHKAIPETADFVFATDVRFPNEADSIISVGGLMIRINVDDETIARRTAERDGLQYSYDAKSHPSEIIMDTYTKFNIVVNSEFNASDIVDEILGV